MVAIVRRRVRAEADGVITVKCAEVRKGHEVEVIVLPCRTQSEERPRDLSRLAPAGRELLAWLEELDERTRRDGPPPPLMSLYGLRPGFYGSGPDDVVKHLREERDACEGQTRASRRKGILGQVPGGEDRWLRPCDAASRW